MTSGGADKWLVVRTQPNRERWAAENVANQHRGELYLPLIATRVSRAGRVATVARPLFPTYFFVRTENGAWYFLLGTFGVTGVVMGASGAATVDDGIIKDLAARERDGVVVLPPRPRFSRGDRVQLTRRAGAFNHCEGIVDDSSDSERVRVLLDLLGRKTTVLVAERALAAA